MFKNQRKVGQNHRKLGPETQKSKKKTPNHGQNHRNLGQLTQKSKKKTHKNKNAKIIEI